MNIRISPEASISISELAFDEHVPSIKLMIEIEIKSEIFSLIQFDCWLECYLIDDFFSAVRQGKKASLSDFDGNFFISINNNKVTWKYVKENTVGTNSYFFFEGSEMALENIREKALEALDGYPKWW